MRGNVRLYHRTLHLTVSSFLNVYATLVLGEVREMLLSQFTVAWCTRCERTCASYLLIDGKDSTNEGAPAGRHARQFDIRGAYCGQPRQVRVPSFLLRLAGVCPEGRSTTYSATGRAPFLTAPLIQLTCDDTYCTLDPNASHLAETQWSAVHFDKIS